MDHQTPPGPPVLPPAPPYQPGPPTRPRPPWNGKTNGFAIASLALSLIGCVGLLSIVFGVIGLRQATRNGDRRGRFFAIAGLSICGLWITALVVAAVVNIGRMPDRDATTSFPGQGSITRAELRAGHCLQDLVADNNGYVSNLVPCTEPHDTEVVDRYELPAGDWPGDEQVESSAEAECAKRYVEYTHRQPNERSIRSIALTPTLADWPANRGVLCIAFHPRPTTGSLGR